MLGLRLRFINCRQVVMATTLLRHLTLCRPPPPSISSQRHTHYYPSLLHLLPPSPCHAHLLLTTRLHSSSPPSSSYHEDIYKASSQGTEARIEGPVFSRQTDDDDDEEWYKARAEDEEWFRREESFYESHISEADRHPEQINHNCDYLSLSDSALFAQCRMDTFRASGPGGQHRNKTDSGVRLTHLPTAVVAQAVEDRSQHKNRATAMNRLRLLIAAKVRQPLKLREYQPPPELVRLLPAETSKKHIGDKIGINHPDYPKAVQALLDLLAASQGYISYAAMVLRVNPAALSKILTSDKTLLQATNELLISKGQKPFK